MWLRRIWTRIRDTVVKKFGVWVDKECPLIEDEDDLNGEKAVLGRHVQVSACVSLKTSSV